MKRVKNLLTILTVLVLGLTMVGVVSSQDDESAKVVPDRERKIAGDLAAEGPTETTGVESAAVLGALSLAGLFADADGHVLRAREVVVSPGGQIAVHQHTGRPGIAYMLEGEMVEYQSGAEPAIRKAGEIVFEQSGTVHWWRNESDAKASALVIDIVPAETE